MDNAVNVQFSGVKDVRKKIKILVCAVVALLVIGSMCRVFQPVEDSEKSVPVDTSGNYTKFQTSEGVEKHIYQDTEDYYKRAQQIIEEREKQYSKSSVKGMIVAHADDKTAFYDDLQKNTRFTDRWLNGNYLTGVKIGLDLVFNTMEVQTGGQSDNELVIKPFYELTGKLGVSYTKYIDGEWKTLLTEVITAYAPFVPSASNNYGSYMVNPPDFPEWSLRGIQPNEICYMRELETGDITYFIYHPAGSSNQCNATWLNTTDKFGTPVSGTSFAFDTNSVYVEDSSGRHDFYTSGDHAVIQFVTNDVNTIFTGYGQIYLSNYEDLGFWQNTTIARNFTWFYCSYLITNADEHDQSVVNNVQVNNNWEYNQYPIYRFTNNYFTSTYDDQDTHIHHYLDQTTINNYNDMGLTYDSNTNKFDLDPTVLAGAVAGALIPELQGAFEGVFALQPDIGLPFSAVNNTLDYNDLIVDSGGGSGGEVWIPPEYPDITTYDIVVRPVFPATTESLPEYLPDTAQDIYSVADRLLGPEILPILLALALFGICVYLLT